MYHKNRSILLTPQQAGFALREKLFLAAAIVVLGLGLLFFWPVGAPRVSKVSNPTKDQKQRGGRNKLVSPSRPLRLRDVEQYVIKYF